MSNYVVSDTSLGSVADAIRNKGKTSELLEYPQGFIDAIEAIGKDEPVPEDGKTRIWIRIPEDTPDNRLTFYLRFTASTANNTTVDWGDGVSETLGSTTVTNYDHKYSQCGDYIITMTVNTGTISFEGTSGTSGYSIYGSRASSNYYNRSRIKRIIFGDDVMSIGDYTAYYCQKLEAVTLPNNITNIGQYAFSNCNTLKSVTIPDNVTVINNNAFINCNTLESVTIPDSVTVIGEGAFTSCSSLKSVTIPDSVTAINNNAFSYCSSLTSVTIPDSVTVINNTTFINCNTLESIILPNSLTTIGASSFGGNSVLTILIIPSSVTSIGTSAFSNCFGMSEYHFKPTIPPTLANTNAFNKIPSDCIIYVPKGSLSAYKTATNWSTYASQMREEPT